MNLPRFRPVHTLLIGLILLALYGSLTVGVQRHLLFVDSDRRISDKLHEHAVAHPEVAATFKGVTTLSERRQIWLEGGSGLLILAILRRWRWLAVWAGMLAGVFVGRQLKALLDRARPVFDDPILKESTSSFPSGHAVGSMLIFGALLYFLWNQWPRVRGLSAPLLALLILAIGFSRVYLGLHWPTDVLGGYLFGLGWLLAAIGLVNAVAERRAGSASASGG